MSKIVLATEKDLNTCFQIIEECAEWLAKSGMNHWKSYYTKEKVRSKLQSSDFEIYLLNTDFGEYVATITLGTKPPEYYTQNDEKVNHLEKFMEPSANAIYITALGVKPKSQGNGYAKMMVNFAEDSAKSKSASYIRFDARGDYTKLVEFYKKLGYKIVGDMPDTDSVYYLFEKKV